MHFVDSSTEISIEILEQQWQELALCSLTEIDRGVIVLIARKSTAVKKVVFVHDEASYTEFRMLFEAAEDNCVKFQQPFHERFRMELIAAIDKEKWPGVKQPLLLRARLTQDIYYSQVMTYLKYRRATHPHLSVVRNTYVCSVAKVPMQAHVKLDASMKKRKKYWPGLKLPALPPGATRSNALAIIDATARSLQSPLVHHLLQYPLFNNTSEK